MSKPTKATLHGYAKSPLGLPGMVIPVFKVGDGWFVQDTGRDGLVSCFEEIEVRPSDKLLPASGSFSHSVGDEPIYAVAFDEEDVIMGTKSTLAKTLNFADPRLTDHPELRLDLAEFWENKAALEQAERDLEAKAAALKYAQIKSGVQMRVVAGIRRWGRQAPSINSKKTIEYLCDELESGGWLKGRIRPRPEDVIYRTKSASQQFQRLKVTVTTGHKKDTFTAVLRKVGDNYHVKLCRSPTKDMLGKKNLHRRKNRELHV